MKLLKIFLMLNVCALLFVSCGDNGNNASGKSCNSSFDCPLGYTCDPEKKVCSKSSDGSEDSNLPDESDSGNQDVSDTDSNTDTATDNDSTPGEQNGDDDPVTGDCEPGKEQKCPYQGASGTENVGPCKAAVRICQDDGTWGKCEGEVLPVSETGDELCNDEIDNDCNGIVDDGTDFDKDGHGACSDCCESIETCANPKETWDPEKDLCTYNENIEYDCDTEISADSTNPEDYAKAIGLCRVTTEDSPLWGLISAKITAPDGSIDVHENSNGLVSKFGDSITPKSGNYMLALTSGKIKDNKFEKFDPANTQGFDPITSGAPSDWLSANGDEFPSAGSCNGTSGTSGDVNDAVMLEMEIKTPKSAKSFSFNIYFFTIEYPDYICTEFNDFFIALLDSTYQSSDPDLQNPADKNLAMDANHNPVGVNLAPAGLFTQCKELSTVTNIDSQSFDATSCTGTDELQGTGFENNGATGWLTTRGNVVGGEIIKLRFAIWDLTDHQLDSLVLIDNFKWEVTEQKPGTGPY